jgi:hypothetical protein
MDQGEIMPRCFVPAGMRPRSAAEVAKTFRAGNEIVLVDTIFELPMASKTRVESQRLTKSATIQRLFDRSC